MMLVVLLAFGAVASASQAWTPGREFVYEYKTRTMTGVPFLKNQASGMGLRSKVIFQVKSENELYAKMTEVSVARAVNEENSESYETWRREMNLEYSPLESKQGISVPFKVNLREGKVESIETSPEEPIWVVNIKRGLATQLSLNMNKIQRQRIFTAENEISKSSEEFFTVEEESSVTGECKTHYTIVPLPEYLAKSQEHQIDEELKKRNQERPAWIITKTRDYNSCSKKPAFIHSSFVDEQDPTSSLSDAQQKRFTSRTSVSRYLVRGEPMHKFIVERVWTEGEYVVQPFATNTESIFIVSNQTLVLKKEEPVSSSFSLPSQLVRKSLLFQLVPRNEQEEAELQEQIYKQYNIRQESPYDQMQSDFGRMQSEYEQQYQGRSRDEFESEEEYKHYQRKYHSHKQHRISPESYEYPKLTKAPQMMYVSGEPVPVQKVKQQIRELVQRVEEQVESLEDLEKEALPMTVLKISRALSTLDLEEIKSVYRELVQERSYEQRLGKAEKTKKDVLLDAIAMCGTNPCVIFLKELIEKREVRGEQASSLLMVLPITVKTPTRELLQELVSLIKSVKSHSEQNEQVWFTSFLSTATLINRACVNQKSRRDNYSVSPITKRPYCTSEEIELLLPYLKQELKESTKTSRAIVLLQAIGNLGSYHSYNVLRQVVTGQMHSEKQIRAKAIFALARIAEEAPFHLRHEIQALLKPIYSSPVEEDEVRMSAFVALLATQPEEHFYTEAATSTWFEPSQQVGQFVYSTLENMANCTYPSHRNESRKAGMALPLAKRYNLGLQYSANSIFSHFIPEHQIGSTFQLARFGGKHSLFPEQIYLELKNFMGGFDFPIFRSSFQSQGIQNFFNRFLGPQEREEQLDTGLNIHTRKDNQLQGNLWVQMMGSMERVITLDTLREWAMEGIVEYTGEKEYSINYQKTIPLEDATVVLPIDSGLPIYATRKTPVFISLRGTVEFDMDVKKFNARKFELPREAKLVLKLKPVIAMTRLIEAGISSPLTKEVFLSGHQTNTHLNLPGKLEVIFRNNQLEITSERLQNLPSKLELVSYRSYPYTAQAEIYNFVKKNYKHIQVQHELKEWKMKFGQETFGLNFELKGKVDAPLMNLGGLYERVRQYNPLTFVTYLFVRERTLREPDYKILLDLSQSETQRMKLRLSYNKEHENVSIRKFSEEERLLNKYYKEKSHKFQQMSQEFEKLWKKPEQLFSEDRQGQSYNIRSSEERRRMEEYEQEIETETAAVVRSLHAEIICEGRENRHLRSSSIWTSSADKLQQKMSFIFEREASSSSSPYKVHACGRLQYPRLPNRRTEMYQSSKTTVGHVGVKYGSNLEYEINTRVVLDQTQQWLREIEKSAIAKQCSRFEQEGAPYAPVCLHARREATALNKAVVQIEAKNACKRFMNATQHIDDYLKAKYYPYMTNKRVEVRNPEKEIKMVFDIKPIQSQRQSWLVLDSYIFKQWENTFYQNVKFSQFFEYFLPINAETPISIRAFNKVLGYQYVPVCEIQRELITTFDNVTYKYPIDECYHLIAKDCSREIPVQVLAKQVSGGKWVKLEAGKIQVEISPELEVQYNGEKIRPSLYKEEVVKNSEGKKYLAIQMIKEGKLMVSAPIHGVKILSDGKHFQIQMSNMYRGRVCGLCGDMNGEKVAELKDPQGCVRSSVKDFAESYILGSCSDRQSRPLEKSECVREYTAVPASLSLRSPKWETRRVSSGIRYTNKVIPRESETCFSIKPITECPVGTKPTGHVTKKIAFHCVPRGRVANEMIARSRSGVLEELFSKSEDFSELVSMPEACENIRSSSSRGYGHRAM